MENTIFKRGKGDTMLEVVVSKLKDVVQKHLDLNNKNMLIITNYDKKKPKTQSFYSLSANETLMSYETFKNNQPIETHQLSFETSMSDEETLAKMNLFIKLFEKAMADVKAKKSICIGV